MFTNKMCIRDSIEGAAEQKKRTTLVNRWTGNLVLESPDSVINQMFSFSKIRACESIYATQGGPMHGPGGESYYAAIWANDQAEYINPYFPVSYTHLDVYKRQSHLSIRLQQVF